MKSILSKFCGIFPTIVFDIEEKPIKAKLSTPTISTGERQILKMLADAKKNLSKFKKLHKQGKASIDDVFEVTDRSNNTARYSVSDIKIIDATKQDISVNSNQDELKLITCYPFDAIIAGGPLRYVVTAKLI